MKCDVDKTITGTPEKKYYLIKYLKTELEKILGKEIQIYLVISEKERNDYFNTINTSFNISGLISDYNLTSNLQLSTNYQFGTNMFSIDDKGYSPGELTIPYKKFYDYFEGFFNISKKKNIQKEKKKQLDFLNNKITIGGGGSNFEQTENSPISTEKSNDDIEIEKFLFYTLNKDIRIRIDGAL